MVSRRPSSLSSTSSLSDSLANFDPDVLHRPAVVMRIDAREHGVEAPMHRHLKGQLVVALHGGVTCVVLDGLWMVPPQCAVWIPGGVLHSNRVTANGRVCFLFVETSAASLPDQCCTLVITPLVRELIEHLGNQPQLYPVDGPTGRLAAVLLDQLAQMPIENLHLPISTHVRLRQIADALTDNPADRSTLAEWGQRVAMSERTLARLVKNETGMTFGRWRQQLHIVIALQRLSAGARVQQVAEDLGYESVAAFITMFKKALGKPPARYFADRQHGQDD
jgi:AraC-like DNA-binding protein